MIKSVKKVLLMLLAIIAVIVPLNVLAADSSLELKCSTDKIKPEAKSHCEIYGTSSANIKSISMTIHLSDGITDYFDGKTSFFVPAEAWNGSTNSSEVCTKNEENYNYNCTVKSTSSVTGTFKIADIYFSGESGEGYDSNIKVGTITLTDTSDNITSAATITKNFRVMSNNNKLAQVLIDDDVVEPFGDRNPVYNYTTQKDSVNIAAQKYNAKATVSGDIGRRKLEYGQNIFYIYVTAEDGTIKTHSINITREDTRSNNNYLYKFGFIDKDINFDKDKAEYELTIENKVNKLASCYTKVNQDNILCIDENEFTYVDSKSGSLYIINDKYENEIIPFADVVEKCEDNSPNRVCKYYYKDELVGEYITLLNGRDVTLDYMVLSDLNVGLNTLKVVVIAENESEREYVFKINRLNEEGKSEVKNESNAAVENPKTGAFISIALLVGILGGSTYVIHNLKKKNKFNN